MGKKQEIITFKADQDLLDAIGEIPNRSEFIRSAIMAYLGSVCPLCNGTGWLTPSQKHHWDDFAADHSVKWCRNCHERFLVCENGPHERDKAPSKK